MEHSLLLQDLKVEKDTLTICWETPLNISHFNLRWLRDSCTCSKCFHAVTLQRRVDLLTIPKNLKALSVSQNHEKQELEIKWGVEDHSEEEHLSTYSYRWLYSLDKPKKIPEYEETHLWGSEILQSAPEISFEEIQKEGDSAILRWLNLVHKYGFCFVSGVPVDAKETENFLKKISYIRETIYGGFWEFTANMAMKDLAYSNLELQCHNDGCYFRDPPGLQCFHLLEFQGEGGQTMLVDGFRVAEEMKKRFPEEYEMLCKTRLKFQYLDENNTLFQTRPILQLDENDMTNLLRVNFNNDDRTSDLPPSLVKDPAQATFFYQSLTRFMELLRDPRYEIQFPMKPGQVVVINNWRVLHGRRAFSGVRRLSGCYFNYEDFQSRRRTLSAKLKKM